MVRLISRQRGGLAALKLTKLFGIDDFPAAKDSGKVLIIIIYCYLIIIITRILIIPEESWFGQVTDIVNFQVKDPPLDRCLPLYSPLSMINRLHHY